MYMRASKLLLMLGIPLAAVASLVITMYLAKAGGDGCFLLVFFLSYKTFSLFLAGRLGARQIEGLASEWVDFAVSEAV